jgi:outer membrane protein assembly factor BamB
MQAPGSAAVAAKCAQHQQFVTRVTNCAQHEHLAPRRDSGAIQLLASSLQRRDGGESTFYPRPSAVHPLPTPTVRPRPRRAGFAALALLAAGALLAAACGRPPGPSGWAAPQRVEVNGQATILVARKSHLFSLDSSGAERWRFPARDKNAYPLSRAGQDAVKAKIDAAGSIPDGQKSALKSTVGGTTLGGPTVKTLKDAVNATSSAGASSSDRKAIISEVDARTTEEKDALGNVEALYGDIGVSPDGKTLYVPTFGGGLWALDADTGESIWYRDMKDGMVGGVSVGQGAIYVGTKGKRVFALDPSTGGVRWTADVDGEVWATPALDGGVLYVTSLKGSVFALDASSGSQKWRFGGAGSGIASKAVVADGAVYVGAFDNKLYALDASDGSERWSFSADNWFWATPVVDGDTVFAASLDGRVYAIDASDGTARWPASFDAGAPVRSGLVLAGGGVVVAARDGDVFKIDPGSGQAQGPAVAIGDRVYASLSAADQGAVVYVSPAASTLYVLDVSGQPAITSQFALPQ